MGHAAETLAANARPRHVQLSARDFLESLTNSADAGVKYFSGATATYATTVSAPDESTKLSGRMLLDLDQRRGRRDRLAQP
jgi:hypothetical protein